jgi:hypothetical protein
MVVSASNTLSLLRVRGSGHVERFREVVILPTRSSPEEALISNLIDHLCLYQSLTILIYLRAKEDMRIQTSFL